MPVEMPTLARLFDKMEEGMLIVDAEWRILYANDFARRYLNLRGEGRIRDELIPKLFGRFLFDTDAPALIAGGEAQNEWSLQFEATTPDVEGHPPFVLSIYMSRPNEEGARFLLLRDVTEERGEELWKEKFLSLISHKLMTPISTISLNLSSMGEKILGPLTPKQEGAIAVAAEKLKSLKRSVRRLIQYASLVKMETTGIVERVDLAKAVRSYCDRAPRSSGGKAVAIACEGAPAAATVVARESLLCTALDNIVENAVKFHPGPTVRIGIALRQGKAGEIEIAIRDDGPGIPPALQGDVFKEFVQRDDDFTGNIEGLGLGLPFVHHLMRVLKGRAVLESEPGRGTTVRLILPLAQREEPSLAPAG